MGAAVGAARVAGSTGAGRNALGLLGLSPRDALGAVVSSQDKATLFVRTGRTLYFLTAAGITVAWYTGWRNQRVPEGEVTFPFPGLTKRGKYLPASRPDKDEPTSGGAAPILTPPDPTKALTPFAGAGLHQGHENFNRNWYTARHHIAQQIGQRFRLRVTSGYRDPAHNRAAGGVEKSFHVDGLAFDFVGAVSDMRQGYEWAKQSGMFQEIMLHNAGSGLHLHLAFLAGNPDAFRRAGPTRTPITR